MENLTLTFYLPEFMLKINADLNYGLRVQKEHFCLNAHQIKSWLLGHHWFRLQYLMGIDGPTQDKEKDFI